MSCCGGAEEDSYGPPANQAVPPPNANAPGTQLQSIVFVANAAAVDVVWTTTTAF